MGADFIGTFIAEPTVTEFYDDIVNSDCNRDVDLWTIDEKRYYVTGGLSWGDPPTDAYDVMQLVHALGVTG